MTGAPGFRGTGSNQAGSKLIQISFTQGYSTGGNQLLHHKCRFIGCIGKARARGGGGDAS